MTLQAWDRVRAAAGLAGFAIAAYLTVLHYDANVPLVCATSGVVNCERVLSSPASLWAGIPVAVFGAAWFAIAAALAFLSLARRGAPEPAWLRRAALGWAVLGGATVVWLLYTELAVIGSLCAWCTAVHALVVGLFAVQVLTDPARAAAGPGR